jgi:hypothetical protein
MEDDIESQAALIQPWHERRDQMRERAAQWIRSAAFRGVFYDDAHPPLAAQMVLGQEMKRKEAVALRKKTEVFGLQTPQLWKQYQDLAQNGVLVFGHVIIVNPGCADQPNHNLPCLVLVPEDQRAMAVAQAGGVAVWLGEIYAGLITDEPALTKLLRDDEFQLFRRRTLPPHPMLRGEGHLLDLAVRLTWLPPEGMPFIPILIQPGRKGAAQQIPWSIATGTPPIPGSMQRGLWGEFADLDQEADRMVAQQNSQSGCRFWFHRVVSTVFFLGLGLGLLQYIKEQIWPPAPPATSTPAAPVGPAAPSKSTILWKQSSALRRQATPVAPEEYQPLQVSGTNSLGFLFTRSNNEVLAASPRADSTMAPGELWFGGQAHVQLDNKNVLIQPLSHIQLVTGISTTAQTLDFRSDEILEPGAEMLILTGQGDPIAGNLDVSKVQSLKSPPRKLKLKGLPPEHPEILSGCPVILRKTGRVVGVAQAAAGSGAAPVVWFETLSLIPAGP